MRLPKSVPESQKYVTWAFPAILGFSVACFIGTISWEGRIGVILTMAVVFTGWSSFGIVAEADYNDLLLVCDLALLTSYVLLVYYCKNLSESFGSSDLGLWTASTAVFGFYAMWDFAALIARNTSAVASRLHLRKFGFICSIVALIFGAGAVLASRFLQHAENVLEAAILRGSLLTMWLGILIWWHYGRVKAAIVDGRADGE